MLTTHINGYNENLSKPWEEMRLLKEKLDQKEDAEASRLAFKSPTDCMDNSVLGLNGMQTSQWVGQPIE